MGIFGPASTASSPEDKEIAELERKRSLLFAKEYKDDLKKQVAELERKHGPAEEPKELTDEDKMNQFFRDNGIPVTNMKERNSGSTGS